jgi:microcystin-dependent protein
MGSPYIGEIRMFAGNFAPANWAFCNGALIAISQNEALFQLIGTTYGGDGQSTFALPNLQSRVPIHMGSNPVAGTYVLGALGGLENVTLTANQVGSHNHTLNAVGSGASVQSPTNALPGVSTSSQAGTLQYGTGSGSLTTLAPASIGGNVGGQPHANIQPYLTISFIISLFGIFPTQN